MDIMKIISCYRARKVSFATNFMCWIINSYFEGEKTNSSCTENRVNEVELWPKPKSRCCVYKPDVSLVDAIKEKGVSIDRFHCAC